MNEISAIGLHTSVRNLEGTGAKADTPAQLAREFDAMLWRLLWRTASVPGPSGSKPTPTALALPLAEWYLPTIAAQHATGFGAMVLGSMAERN